MHRIQSPNNEYKGRRFTFQSSTIEFTLASHTTKTLALNVFTLLLFINASHPPFSYISLGSQTGYIPGYLEPINIYIYLPLVGFEPGT